MREHSSKNTARRLRMLAAALTVGVMLGQSAFLLRLGGIRPASVQYGSTDQALMIQVSTVSQLQQALDGAVHGATIVIDGDIVLTEPLVLEKQNITLRLLAGAEEATLYAPGSRHLTCLGSNIDLLFEGVTLDGGGTGGGIVTSAAGLSIGGLKIQNCYSAAGGGGIEARQGPVSVGPGTSVRDCTAATYGGGIYTGGAVQLYLDGAVIQDNKAGVHGGGIFSGVGGQLRMESGSVSGNQAVFGGGIYGGTGGQLHLVGGSVSRNTAGGGSGVVGMGGGVYAVTCDVLLQAAEVGGNRAAHGGGLYITGDGSDAVMNGGTISGNEATGANAHGGGVFIDTAYTLPNRFTLNGGSISSNHGVRGGGVFCGGVFASAGSSSPGGPVAGGAVINGGQLASNTAGLGGGLFADEGASLHMEGGMAQGNSAQDGGAVWILPLENLTVEEGFSFQENAADTGVAYPSQEHISLHAQQIGASSFSAGFRYGYNNYDIVYQLDSSQEQQYTVTFEYGDGAEGERQRTVAHGQPVGDLPRPAQAGYRFDGWYTSPGGQGVLYRAETGVTADITLYTHWTAEHYTLRFNYNGAQAPDGAERAKTVTFGESVGHLPIPVPLSNDEAFSGWFDESGTQYFPATPYREDHGKTLTAKWLPSQQAVYQVAFDYKGATGDDLEILRVVAEGGTLGDLPQPQRPGYTFAGWFGSGGEGPYTGGEEVLEDLALTARWEQSTWKVTLEYGEAEPGGLPLLLELEHGASLGQLPAPSRTGYSFTGWYTDSGLHIPVDLDTPVNSDLTLYAGWRAEPHSLYFDYQGAQSPSLPQRKSVAFGQRIGALPLPGREGYTFSGWYEQPEGAGAYYGGGTSGRAYEALEDTLIFANWQGNAYTLSFDYRTAETGSYPLGKTVQNGGNIGALPFPELEGYRFGGWFTQPGGGGQQLFATTQVAVSDNFTLYAHWIPLADRQPTRASTRPEGTRTWQFDALNESAAPVTDNPETGGMPLINAD